MSSVPIACSLTAAAARSQLGEWRAAMAVTVEEADRGSPTELVLRLRPDLAGLGDLVLLAQREKACCPFFDFTVRVSATSSTLVISVPADAIPVLDTFADLAGGRAPDGLN